MVVRKPIEAHSKDVNIQKLINRGGKVKSDKKNIEYRIINLRISADLLDEVDEAVDHRVGIKRTGWILEAIHEKLKKI